ncbi:MAG: glycosyltransferase family 2 protein [Lutibacter sp.]|uniref:glycosyltransferase family 2 protein n=1 Tax=Lutibacter sp. TaxID=1925666 RepID=UPI00299DC30F|nr:glycosyltransferase family 2 protein [Lutibacter sp.]MDX1828188.1 glycosyltransferase family 2 protein [Lutibacter sp.]
MLAIVIPYYKITFFEETLKSLASQTDKSFKVYIGDDASPENPLNVLKKYQDQFNYTYHRYNENLGGTSLVKQWERCIAMVEDEEWVQILGDDDVLDKHNVKSFYENLPEIKKKNISVVRYSTCKINELGDLISDIYTHPKIENAVDFLFRNKRNSLSEYIFGRKKITSIGFKEFPLAWCSDILAVLEFSDFKGIYTINEGLVYIRITNISISGSLDNIKLKNLASEEFSKYIIFNKFYLFDKIQRLRLLIGYEVAIKRNRKFKIKDWFVLTKLYLKNFNIYYFLKFLRRSVIYTFIEGSSSK